MAHRPGRRTSGARHVSNGVLVLCVLTGTLVILWWARSQFALDTLVYAYVPAHSNWVQTHPTAAKVNAGNVRDAVDSLSIYSSDGQIALGYFRKAAGGAAKDMGRRYIGDEPGWHFKTTDDVPTNLFGINRNIWHRIGFHAERNQWRLHASTNPMNRYGGRLWLLDDRWISFPHWVPLAIVMPVPLHRAMRMLQRRRRMRRNRCPDCAYDLRATPGRCPECGWSHADALAVKR